MFTFLSFQLFVYILSAVCLLFLSFCKQTADFVYISQFSAVCLHFSVFVNKQLTFSAKSSVWLFRTKLTSVQRQYPFSVFDSWLCLLFLSFCKQTADSQFSAVCLHSQFSVFVNKQLTHCLLFLSFVNKQLISQFL